MRVLCVTSTFPRWESDSTTLFILDLCRHLQARGAQVDVLAPHAPGAAVLEDVHGLSVERFRYWAPERGETICYGGGALFNLKGSPTAAAKLPALIGAQYAAVQRRLRAHEYDVVHAHWLLPQGWVATRAPGRRRTPVVSTIHGSDVFGLQHPVLARFKRSALRQSAAVTVNSSATAAAVAQLGVPGVTPHLIPMGTNVDVAVDPELVAAMRARHRRGGGPLLAFVGRLVDWKGVDDLLRAVRLIADTTPDVSLAVAGDGQLRGELEECARQLRIADRVTFLGWIAPPEVAALQAAADVNVVPSRTASDGSREAQGLSVVEAMISGRPLVATDAGGVPDAVRSGETGLLVPERSPESIAAAVRTLVSDPARADAMGAAARADARSRYSWEQTAESFLTLFDQVQRRASTGRS